MIVTYNRYRDSVHFDKISEGKYKFYTLDEKGVPVDYGWRVIMDKENENILSVDPPGGPFISVGNNLKDEFPIFENERVIKIELGKEGVIITTNGKQI